MTLKSKDYSVSYGAKVLSKDWDNPKLSALVFIDHAQKNGKRFMQGFSLGEERVLFLIEMPTKVANDNGWDVGPR